MYVNATVNHGLPGILSASITSTTPCMIKRTIKNPSIIGFTIRSKFFIELIIFFKLNLSLHRVLFCSPKPQPYDTHLYHYLYSYRAAPPSAGLLAFECRLHFLHARAMHPLRRSDNLRWRDRRAPGSSHSLNFFLIDFPLFHGIVCWQIIASKP